MRLDGETFAIGDFYLYNATEELRAFAIDKYEISNGTFRERAAFRVGTRMR
ncbi:hypothetical protein GHA01_16560 [Novacetimonas hansenii]|uniref:Uncharacterized protein n=2 Tax=Novacetimonas hansenii TaxID=436 RepID=A0ABQ0SFD8_NOVHA|nr:hypothetical protein GXY_06920 [Novacetimonas hansenii ATCC 23769]GAN83611.1 hypothetical protein Gaha_0091_006 [Novacetimonas hansenii JCM 7643]GBQ61133.1 hypothetical protein AA0243_2568 [Novacetimonas hansenii NRIC 0243]GEC63807.1 hypothetical protein GHA01_16560 [Novacetimonas hansenii]